MTPARTARVYVTGVGRIEIFLLETYGGPADGSVGIFLPDIVFSRPRKKKSSGGVKKDP